MLLPVLSLLMIIYLSKWLSKGIRQKKSLGVVILIAVVAIIRDIAEMIGFIDGYIDRQMHPGLYKQQCTEESHR